MINRVSAALRRIQSDLAQVLDAEQITEVCSEVGYRFRKRILDPTTTIHLFVTQIVNGNFAVARLEEFTDKQFSEAAYCNARGRLPVQVLQTLLKRVGSALQPILNDAGRWRKHRTFHIDGSAFSMPDTEELLTAFGQPGRQRAGCGFPVAHLLTLFHAGTGFLMKALAAPLRTHDMKEAALLLPAGSCTGCFVFIRSKWSISKRAGLTTAPADRTRRDDQVRGGSSGWESKTSWSSISNQRTGRPG